MNNKNIDINLHISSIKDEIYDMNKFMLIVYNHKLPEQEYVSYDIEYILNEINRIIKNNYKQLINQRG